MFQVEDIHPKPRAFTRTSRGVAVLAALLPFNTPAACAGDDRFIGDEYHYQRNRALRKICDGCPLMDACAEWGIAHEEFGFWGGLTPTERDVARKIRGQVRVEPHTGHTVAPDFMADPFDKKGMRQTPKIDSEPGFDDLVHPLDEVPNA